MKSEPYFVPSDSVVFEEEIKKSLFITYLQHTASIDEAKLFVNEIKAKHSDARHHCWAFAAGRCTDSMLWGFSDDGEPSGTAGKPMLAQLSGSGIGEITAVVTRYSGGIKLGTGGLVKAYGGGVQSALRLLPVVEKKITIRLELVLEYELIPLTQSIMKQYDAIEISSQYTHNVVLMVELDVRQSQAFKDAVINKSSAKVLVNHP
jgi:uncharacterized YigZ family protein